MDWTPVLATLGDDAEAEPAGAFPTDATRGGLYGVYSWWADEEARSLIGRVLGAEVPALIYIGKAGGETSTQTFLSRIRGKHMRGTTRTSTLRKTLTAILMADPAFASRYRNPRAVETKRAVSAWMAEHLRITTVPIPGVALVEAAEQAAIARFDPPLNLTHVGRSDIRNRLHALRKALQAAVAEAPSDEDGAAVNR
ncbi:MAG: GIY-YIG nuclease family protein [Dehalococcoidia bacterium]